LGTTKIGEFAGQHPKRALGFGRTLEGWLQLQMNYNLARINM